MVRRLSVIQKQVDEWARKNFGNSPSYHPLLGVSEEVGELCHAHLKEEQGIRGTSEELQEKAKDAIADIVIYLCDYCNRREWDIEDLVSETWDKVKQRKWKAKKVL